MTKQFAVVCEASADRLIATDLADRVMLEGIGWLEADLLDSQRAWLSEVSANDRTTELLWKKISALAKSLGIRLHGHFRGEPGLPDASVARRAILVIRRLTAADAVVLMRDADKQIVRRQGLEQARDHSAGPLAIVIGVANPEREAWVISGFDPIDTDESNLLSGERLKLGFDPREQSHRLTATNVDTAKKSPKRVVTVLTQGSFERERLCWMQTPLAALRERGMGNGLNDYLADVESKLVPLITGAT